MIDIQEQYDKIYRYCYIHVSSRETAEDITQETFLRFFEKPDYHSSGKAMQILYTIARNLCADEYRKKKSTELSEDIPSDENIEDEILTNLSLKDAIGKLSIDERAIIMMRYVNDVPTSVIAKLYDVSRFSMNRRINMIIRRLHDNFGEEEQHEEV